jgi:hypothetical protein
MLLCGWTFIGTICQPPNPVTNPAQTDSSPDTNAKEKAFVDSTGTPPSRTVVWPPILIKGENGQTLCTITEPAVTLVISQDNPTGTRKCAVTFQGTLNPTQWSTTSSWNGRLGQPLFIRLRNNNTGLIQLFDIGQVQVACGTGSRIIDKKEYYDEYFFHAVLSAEFIVQGFRWIKCSTSALQPAFGQK